LARTSESYLWKYEIAAKSFLSDVDLDDINDVFTEFEDLIMFRYRLDGEKVRSIDAEHLPSIYEAIVSKHPNLKDYLLKSFKVAGVDLSIFQKTPVQS